MADIYNFVNFKNDTLQKSLEDAILSVYTGNVYPLTFIYIEEDTIENRVLLRKSLNSNFKGNYVLVSKNPNISLLAWKANLLAFVFIDEALLEALHLLNNRVKSFPPILFPSKSKLKLNYKGGVEFIDIEMICFCSGSGNYTEVYLQNGKKKCMSYPLGEIEKRFFNINHINRIGKSFIVNYNRVKMVKRNRLVFKADVAMELVLSDTYIKRIKQNILWY